MYLSHLLHHKENTILAQFLSGIQLVLIQSLSSPKVVAKEDIKLKFPNMFEYLKRNIVNTSQLSLMR